MAECVVETIREERFYALPHPEVEEYVRRKGDNIDALQRPDFADMTLGINLKDLNDL